MLGLLTIACEQAADPAEAHGEGDGPRGCELVAVGCRHAREITREIASRELNGNTKVVRSTILYVLGSEGRLVS